MNLPNSCEECLLSKPYGLVGDRFCTLCEEYFTGNTEPPYKERPDECPLCNPEFMYNYLTEKYKPVIDNLLVWTVEGQTHEDRYSCRKCSHTVKYLDERCTHCGRLIDWSEN